MRISTKPLWDIYRQLRLLRLHLKRARLDYQWYFVLWMTEILQMDNGSEMDGKWPMTILYSLYYEFSKRYPHSRITGMKQETTCSKIELLFRMMNYTIGEKAFRKGLQNFIKSKWVMEPITILKVHTKLVSNIFFIV